MVKINSGFSSILVCIDNSKQSKKALSRAISLVEKYNSKLSMLMVIDERQISFWDDTEYEVGAERPQIHLKKESKIYQQAEKILNDLILAHNVFRENQHSTHANMFSEFYIMEFIIIFCCSIVSNGCYIENVV